MVKGWVLDPMHGIDGGLLLDFLLRLLFVKERGNNRKGTVILRGPRVENNCNQWINHLKHFQIREPNRKLQ